MAPSTPPRARTSASSRRAPGDRCSGRHRRPDRVRCARDSRRPRHRRRRRPRRRRDERRCRPRRREHPPSRREHPHARRRHGDRNDRQHEHVPAGHRRDRDDQPGGHRRHADQLVGRQAQPLRRAVPARSRRRPLHRRARLLRHLAREHAPLRHGDARSHRDVAHRRRRLGDRYLRPLHDRAARDQGPDDRQAQPADGHAGLHGGPGRHARRTR